MKEVNIKATTKIVFAILLFIGVILFINGDRFLGIFSIPKNPANESDKAFSKINPDDLVQGCPGRDCIPSIDNPQFESIAHAKSWLKDGDIVFGISHKGVERAYPQRILNWHEIVNDSVGGDPVAVTFCPLCGSAVAFERKVNGKTVELGVSGKLHNNDLVMYDRTEESLWQQLTGEAIVGVAAKRNERLKKVPLTTATWGQWKKEHPQTQILSRNTGHVRDYDVYPYGTYEQDDQIYFGLKNSPDKRLPLKEVVYGFDVDGAAKAYTQKVLKERKIIEDTVDGQSVRVEYKKDGEVQLTVINSGKTYVPVRNFWFAWAAFHPNTELFK